MCSFRRFGHPLLICARMMFRIVLSKGVETQLPHYLMKEVVGEQGSEVVLLFICVCSSGNWSGRVSTTISDGLECPSKYPHDPKSRYRKGGGANISWYIQIIFFYNYYYIYRDTYTPMRQMRHFFFGAREGLQQNHWGIIIVAIPNV